MSRAASWFSRVCTLCAILSTLQRCFAYQVLMFVLERNARVELQGTDIAYAARSDKNEARQVCTGMWGSGGSRDPYIEVVFSPSARGQLALIIYEWSDARYIGIDSDGSGIGENQWESERLYVCNLAAYRSSLCKSEELGQFIVDMPDGSLLNSTSIWTTAVRFDTTAARPNVRNGTVGMSRSSGPFKYNVNKTGYYCVGAVPVTVTSDEDDSLNGSNSTLDAATPFGTVFTGVVDFENTFEGHLPAAEYPKIWFYTSLAVVYTLIGAGWAFLCFKHRQEILPIQHYISATIAFIVIEMFALAGYYRYLNNSGTASLDKLYLALVSILNAARNSISFFMLLIVCMGYGVVRPSLGSTMLRVRILAIVHFIFGLMYSIGIVTIPLESAGIFIFFFVFPLAFSLTAFMMWIMWSLNATIQDLETRKQSFKKQMFTQLYRILVAAVIVIMAFFVITSMSFSNRLDEDYAPDTWQSRWWLLDGWLGLLYLACFSAIAFIWRPNDNNRRLAMSDELATDEAEADEFEVDTLRDERLEAEENADGKHGPPAGYGGVGRDEVVFDIGDEADSEEEGDMGRQADNKGKKGRKSDEEEAIGEEGERLRRSGSSERDRRSIPPAYSSR